MDHEGIPLPDTDTTVKDDVYLMQIDRIQVFKEQNHEKGHFDMALEVQGKKLFVHKYFLACASETFNAIISNRWNKNNDEVIKIENPEYSFENIYQLISFIYSCQCEITAENVFVLTDMAEFYGILLLKERCIDFLCNMEVAFDKLENMIDIAQRYSLDRFSETLKVEVSRSLSALVESEQFSSYKKPFIEFMAVATKITAELEEKFFTCIYKWAHHQATIKATEEKDAALDLDDTIKAELKEFLPNIKWSNMSFKFVKESVVTKRSLFEPKDLYQILLTSNRNHVEEEECFKTLYELAYELCDGPDDKSINKAIKKELADILPKIEFHRMSIKFLIDFVVDFGIELSYYKVFACMRNCQKLKKEEAFKSVYLLSEKQVLKKQNSLQNNQIKLHEAVQKELADVLIHVNFNQMDVTFWMDFAIDKGFVLFSLDFYFEQLKLKYSNQQELFKIIYQLAEKLVLKQQETLKIKNFNIYVSLRNKLANILPFFNFSQMPLPFLLDSVIGKGIFLSATVIRDFYIKSRINYGPTYVREPIAFRYIYDLVEKQVDEEQKISPNKSFNRDGAIKYLLSETIPVVNFKCMSRKFLDEFVVAKGILTEEEAYDLTRVTIQSGNLTMVGIFDNKYGIQSKKYYATPCQRDKLQFRSLKFKIPTIPSTVSKMKGAEWFLCFEKDGIVCVKFRDKIERSDYLIAEMKTTSDFKFVLNKPAILTVSSKNV